MCNTSNPQKRPLLMPRAVCIKVNVLLRLLSVVRCHCALLLLTVSTQVLGPKRPGESTALVASSGLVHSLPSGRANGPSEM